jgi:hypothetical protein
MNDIKSRADLELLMDSFYHKLLNDDSIDYIFTDVAQIDIDSHLPVIVDFWEQTELITIQPAPAPGPFYALASNRPPMYSISIPGFCCQLTPT